MCNFISNIAGFSVLYPTTWLFSCHGIAMVVTTLITKGFYIIFIMREERNIFLNQHDINILLYSAGFVLCPVLYRRAACGHMEQWRTIQYNHGRGSGTFGTRCWFLWQPAFHHPFLKHGWLKLGHGSHRCQHVPGEWNVFQWWKYQCK